MMLVVKPPEAVQNPAIAVCALICVLKAAALTELAALCALTRIDVLSAALRALERDTTEARNKGPTVRLA